MKRLIVFILALLSFCLFVEAREIKPVKAEFSDYVPLLEEAGFYVLAFDISSLENDSYEIALSVKEYADGELVNTSTTSYIGNRSMLSDFPEDDRKEIVESGEAYDLEKGIYCLSRKITIGFYKKSDSLRVVQFAVEDMGICRSSLRLKSLPVPQLEGRYFYEIRPFVTDSINVNGFTPLVLLGSYWYDQRSGYIRFCGEKEFSADLSSPTLKKIPHYYVIGIKVKK